jgi:hypothetical protein
MTSLSSNGIHTEFLQFSVPRGLYLYAEGSNECQEKYTWALSERWTWAIRTDNCATRFSEKFAGKSFLFKGIVRTGWHIVRTVARSLQVISL